MLGNGGKVVAVLAVWLGFAVLGQGARSSAAFLTTITAASQAVDSDGGCAPSEAQDKSQLPPQLHAYQILLALNMGFQESPGGGAGSTSHNSSGPSSSTALLGSNNAGFKPVLAVLLRSREVLLISTPLTALIFEPPRA